MILNPEFRRFFKEDVKSIEVGRTRSAINHGYVYMVSDGERTKIGQSANPCTRVYSAIRILQAEDPEIWVSTKTPCHDVYEMYMHKRFSESRIEGEWFYGSAEGFAKNSKPIYVIPTNLGGKDKFAYKELSKGKAQKMTEELEKAVVENKQTIAHIMALLAFCSTDEDDDRLIANGHLNMIDAAMLSEDVVKTLSDARKIVVKKLCKIN